MGGFSESRGFLEDLAPREEGKDVDFVRFRVLWVGRWVLDRRNGRFLNRLLPPSWSQGQAFLGCSGPCADELAI